MRRISLLFIFFIATISSFAASIVQFGNFSVNTNTQEETRKAAVGTWKYIPYRENPSNISMSITFNANGTFTAKKWYRNNYVVRQAGRIIRRYGGDITCTYNGTWRVIDPSNDPEFDQPYTIRLYLDKKNRTGNCTDTYGLTPKTKDEIMNKLDQECPYIRDNTAYWLKDGVLKWVRDDDVILKKTTANKPSAKTANKPSAKPSIPFNTVKFTYGGWDFVTTSHNTCELLKLDRDYCKGDIYIINVGEYAGKKYQVTSIADYAFDGCDKITKIEVPEGVTKIGSGAFQNCDALTSITLPSTLESIQIGAFGNVIGLRDIMCYASVPPTVPEYLFLRTPRLHVRKGCKFAYQKAASWKDLIIIEDLVTDKITNDAIQHNKANKAEAKALLENGNNLFREAKYAEALAEYKQYTSMDISNSERIYAYKTMVSLYYLNNDYDEAINTIEKIKSMDIYSALSTQDKVDLQKSYCDCLRTAKQYDKAIEECNRGIKEFDDVKYVFQDALARTYYFKGDKVKSYAVYSQIVEDNPTFYKGTELMVTMAKEIEKDLPKILEQQFSTNYESMMQKYNRSKDLLYVIETTRNLNEKEWIDVLDRPMDHPLPSYLLSARDIVNIDGEEFKDKNKMREALSWKGKHVILHNTAFLPKVLYFFHSIYGQSSKFEVPIKIHEVHVPSSVIELSGLTASEEINYYFYSENVPKIMAKNAILRCQHRNCSICADHPNHYRCTIHTLPEAKGFDKIVKHAQKKYPEYTLTLKADIVTKF